MAKFDEDAYQNKQLNKYLDEQDSNEPVSNCCGAEVCGDSDVCCECKEHCVVITLGQYEFDEKVTAEEDKADAAYEQMREERDET